VRWLLLGGMGCGDPLQRVLQREGDPEAGGEVFALHCASCHGADGSGGEGPDLRDEDDTREELADKILWGWGAMEGFEGTLSVRQVADVIAFVHQEVQSEP
jgi:mono/diheme cytochrome c family protein